MRIGTIAVLLAVSSGIAGCETTGPKQQSGAIIGAIAGGAIGSQFGGSTGGHIAGGLIGAVAGGLIGGGIGAQLDAQDRARLDEITTASLKSGSARSFRNSKTGVSANTRVVGTSNTGGKLCRTVQQDVTLPDGSVSRDTVSGCKGPSGWQV